MLWLIIRSTSERCRKLFLELHLFRKNIKSLRSDFLKIRLFDIWLSNDDRNFDNTDLLLDTLNHRFVPIDHVQVFNGNNLDKPHYSIGSEDSILSSPLLSKIFSRNLQTNLSELRISIVKDFSKSIQLCHDQLQNILDQLPPECN